MFARISFTCSMHKETLFPPWSHRFTLPLLEAVGALTQHWNNNESRRLGVRIKGSCLNYDTKHLSSACCTLHQETAHLPEAIAHTGRRNSTHLSNSEGLRDSMSLSEVQAHKKCQHMRGALANSAAPELGADGQGCLPVHAGFPG